MPDYEVSKYGGVENTLRKMSKDKENEHVLRCSRERHHEKKTTKRKKEKAAAEKRAKTKEKKDLTTQKTYTLEYKMMLARQGKREFIRFGRKKNMLRNMRTPLDAKNS